MFMSTVALVLTLTEQISQNEIASCQEIPQRCSCHSLIVSVQSVPFTEGLKVRAQFFFPLAFIWTKCVH